MPAITGFAGHRAFSRFIMDLSNEREAKMAAVFRSSLMGLLLAVAAATPAWALLANDVSVKLWAPGGIVGVPGAIDVNQVATLADGILAPNLMPNTAGAIRNLMLDDERISFVGNSIHIRVAAGSNDPNTNAFITGYLGLAGDHARYELSGLNVTGEAIIGFSAYAFDGYSTSVLDFTGLISPSITSAISLVNPHKLTLNLDDLIFKDRLPGSSNFAEIRIDLLTTPVPEPTAVASAVLALLGLVAVQRRQRNRRQ
jgi:hypothetical protein